MEGDMSIEPELLAAIKDVDGEQYALWKGGKGSHGCSHCHLSEDKGGPCSGGPDGGRDKHVYRLCVALRELHGGYDGQYFYSFKRV